MSHTEQRAQDRITSADALRNHIRLAKGELEYLIHVTPSGPERNSLTAANVHLLSMELILGSTLVGSL